MGILRSVVSVVGRITRCAAWACNKCWLLLLLLIAMMSWPIVDMRLKGRGLKRYFFLPGKQLISNVLSGTFSPVWTFQILVLMLQQNPLQGCRGADPTWELGLSYTWERFMESRGLTQFSSRKQGPHLGDKQPRTSSTQESVPGLFWKVERLKM